MAMNDESERPRLANRSVAQSEVAQQALAVARADRAGLVDGVEVDFRHPAITPGQWEARAFWHVAAIGPSSAGVLFPSEARAVEKVIDPDHDQLEALSLPRAEPGDRLAVESVIDRISDRRFDHRHDATVKEARLILTRLNGEQIRPEGALAFYGVTQLRDGPQRDAYDRLAERVLSENGNPDPHNLDVRRKLRPWDELWRSPSDLTLSERAALAVEEAERAWLALDREYLPADPRAKLMLRRAMNGAVLAAFYQAKHESKPAEEKAQRVAEGAHKARNQAKARDNRFRYANDIWRDEPHLTLNGLAIQVIEQLYNDGGELLAPSTMAESLERAIGRGDLTVPRQSPHHPDNKG
ncbi:hypothetical protein N0B51_09645 [Tsuneonella sp. YG55]|uniref:Uncharacterized protein n=1 Tax=Tsuneonella litorea TaxID=2976475 RepID=A0A9X3AN54_9SPHN|nr:hypothetical protein [Tsuneonella litorea]MCT2559247.1 hypothetical protein [Tsuneonella litorea]